MAQVAYWVLLLVVVAVAVFAAMKTGRFNVKTYILVVHMMGITAIIDCISYKPV